MNVIPNIGPRSIVRRRTTGVAVLAIGVAIAIMLVINDASRVTRLILLIPFIAAGLELLQAREKT